MVYLDYLLYIVIIVLFIFLMNKIIVNETTTKEGFEHTGNSFVARSSKKEEKGSEKKSSTMEQIVIMVKTTYRIAAEVAIVLIKMPYKFLSKFVDMMVRFIKNINAMLKPMYDFIRQIGKIIKKIFKKMYDQFMKIFRQYINIMRNLPAFIKKMANITIDFINLAVTQTIEQLTNFFNIFKDIFDSLLELPMKFFNIMGQFGTMFANSINMLMSLPEKGLDMVINFQGTLMDMMDKPLKVPFADKFLG